jgi:hypothetical protein
VFCSKSQAVGAIAVSEKVDKNEAASAKAKEMDALKKEEESKNEAKLMEKKAKATAKDAKKLEVQLKSAKAKQKLDKKNEEKAKTKIDYYDKIISGQKKSLKADRESVAMAKEDYKNGAPIKKILNKAKKESGTPVFNAVPVQGPKVEKPAAKTTAKPAAKTTAKPAAKTTAKPAAKTTAKPAAKTTAKPAAKYNKDITGR